MFFILLQENLVQELGEFINAVYKKEKNHIEKLKSLLQNFKEEDIEITFSIKEKRAVVYFVNKKGEKAFILEQKIV